MPSLRRTFAYMFLILAVLTLAFACTAELKQGTWSNGEGLVLTWQPESPRIGDLVHLTAFYPESMAVEVKPFAVSGQQLDYLMSDFSQTGRLISWRVRITQVGEWTWGEQGPLLWKVVSGLAYEQSPEQVPLKVFAAQSLWHASKDPVPAAGGQK